MVTIDTERFRHCRLLVVGDLMLDEYVWGEVERISPEAPVQVVNVLREESTLGGSGNVINNLIALGADVTAAGVVGNDVGGRLLLDRLKGLGVSVAGVVADAQRPTTRKTRIIAAGQHVLRIDRETRVDIPPPVRAELAAAVTQAVADVDTVLISDYGKGVVSRELVQKAVAAADATGKPVIVDPKAKDFSKYHGVFMVTPNRKEAAVASGADPAAADFFETAGRALMQAAATERILITCGKDGMVYLQGTNAPRYIPTEARQVYDVSGAGDTVLAFLGLGLAAGFTIDTTVHLANRAAGIVVGKVGTATVTSGELQAAVDPYGAASAGKQVSRAELPALVRQLRDRGQRIVMTNGCFDLLHTGHIMLFAASKRHGDVLIVAIDDDESVRRLKGAGRPVIGAAERVRILSALDAVDHVVVFASEELDRLIEAVRPDVLTKGSNYASGAVAGRDQVEAGGGRVELIPVTEDISASRIIRDIRNAGEASSKH